MRRVAQTFFFDFSISNASAAARARSSRTWHFAVAVIFLLFGSLRAYSADYLYIGGTPPASVTAPTYYYFQPWVSMPAASRAKLQFKIYNKPYWATFNTASGQLSGKVYAANIGAYRNIIVGANDGGSSTWMRSFDINIVGAGSGSGSGSGSGGTTPPTSPGNSAPVISGNPATTIAVGASYRFQPTASDANGDKLTFSISGQPAWVKFDTSTGLLTGVPAVLNIGTRNGVVISVTDGKATASLPAFGLTVTGSASANSPPTISGTPASLVSVGATYSFVPTAADANGNKLTFSVKNLPSWARFDTSSGRLSGTPSSSAVGKVSNIVISVSDGQASVSLPAFAIVVARSSATGSLTLSWDAPTRNTDGSPLTNLGGYIINYGTSPGALSQRVTINSAATVQYVLGNLPPATYYLDLVAVTNIGLQSPLSDVVSATVN